MASRPRRSAAAKANEVISEHAKWADHDERSERAMSSRRSGRNTGVSRDPASPDDSHLNLTVKVAPGKLRQTTRGASGRNSESFEGGEIIHGKRNRGAKKSYVVDSSPDDDDDEEDEVELDDDDDEDAEGEDVMDMDAEGDDIDAEGEEDAEGDIDMSAAPSPARPTIRVTSKSKPPPRASALKVVQDDDDDDDDDDLSDPGESDEDGDQTMGLGDDTMADEDAEGEEIEVLGDDDDEDEDDEDAEGEDDEPDAGVGLDSDADGSREDTPDVTKMTKRQRARFEEGPGEFMKLSDGKMSIHFARSMNADSSSCAQRSKPRKFSRPKSCPCEGRRWLAGGET